MPHVLKVLTYPRPLRAALVRNIVRRFSLFSYRERLFANAVDRPHYGHCIYEAAQLATRLGYPRLSVIEFGCGGGNGLLNAEQHIAEISKLFPVKFELYGFDTGEGLPQGEDYRDLLHYFRPGQFQMQTKVLQSRLSLAKLVLGNVKDTCKTFFPEYNPAPIGAIFHDLDFYSSTRDALTLFEGESRYFLPRVFMYFDDVIGDNTWLANEYVGEQLAINEFSLSHPTKKIVANRYLPLKYFDAGWVHQIYNYHDFAHPDYTAYVGAAEQLLHEANIRLPGLSHQNESS
jgi:hypothetical protein